MLNQKNAAKFIIALFLAGSSALTFAATPPDTTPDHSVVGSVEVEAPEALEAHEVAEVPEVPEVEALEAPEAAEAPEASEVH